MTTEAADSDSFLILPERSAGVYSPKIDVFYREEQVPQSHSHRVSQSPLKPRYFMKHLENTPCQSCILVKSDWPPLDREDFLIAHTTEYVNAFFDGLAPLRSSNGLGWSPEFAESIRFNNASLFHSIRSTVLKPSTICLSPTSGFHHAVPTCGGGFCTFSGQVVSSIKILREFGLRGAYLDLDGHYGNSIEDSRDFAPELDEAVPRGFNINPAGVHERFLHSLHAGDLAICLNTLCGQEIEYEVRVRRKE